MHIPFRSAFWLLPAIAAVAMSTFPCAAQKKNPWQSRIRIMVPELAGFAYANTGTHRYDNGKRAGEFRDSTYTCWNAQGHKVVEVDYDEGVRLKVFDENNKTRFVLRSKGIDKGWHDNGRPAFKIEGGRVMFWHEDGRLAADLTLAQAIWRDWNTEIEVDGWMVFHAERYRRIAIPELPKLMAAITHRDPWVRAQVCEALASFGRDALPALPVLRQALRKDRFWLVRCRAAAAIANIGPSSHAATPELRFTLENAREQETTRAHAARALGRIGTNAKLATETLRTATKSKSAILRSEAITALAWVDPDHRGQPTKRSEPSIPMEFVAPALILATCMINAKPDKVAVALADAARPQLFPGAIAVALADAALPSADEFHAYLSQVGSEAKSAIPALVHLLGRTTLVNGAGDSAVRGWARTALSQIGKAAIPALREAVAEREDPRSSEAIRVLGSLGAPAIPALIEALWSVSSGHSQAAAKALGSLGSAASPALPELRKALADGDPDTRVSIAKAIAQIHGPERDPPTIPTIAASQNANPTHITVDVICTAQGEKQPRMPKGAKGDAFYLAGHRVEFRIGKQVHSTKDALTKALAPLITDRRLWVPNPRKPGHKQAPRVVLTAGKGVCYTDMIAAHDATLRAGANWLVFHPEREFAWMLPVAVWMPRAQRHILVPPLSKFCLSETESPDRPVIDVLQDGRIMAGERVLYSRKQDGDSFQRLLTHLLERREAMRKKGLIEDYESLKSKGKRVSIPLLIRADKWADWSLVAQVVEQCHNPRVLFWKLHLGVVEVDLEKQILNPR